MMKYLCIMLFFLLPFQSRALLINEIHNDNIMVFPIIAFFEKADSQVYYWVFFRDTGRWKGLSTVSLTINDQNENSSEFLFDGPLRLSVFRESGLKFAMFRLHENLTNQSALNVYPSYEGMIYQIPISVIRQHFKGNITSGDPESDCRSQIDDFLKKEFKAQELRFDGG